MDLKKFKIKKFSIQVYYNDEFFFILKEKMGTRIFDSVCDDIGLIPVRIQIKYSSEGDIKFLYKKHFGDVDIPSLHDFIGKRKVILLIKNPLERLTSGIYESYIHGGGLFKIYYSNNNFNNAFYILKLADRYSSNEPLLVEEKIDLKKYIKSILSVSLLDYYPISDNHIEKYHKPLLDVLNQENIEISEIYSVNSFFTNEIAIDKFFINYNFKNKVHSWIGKKDIVGECIEELINESETFCELYNGYMVDEDASYKYFLDNSNG